MAPDPQLLFRAFFAGMIGGFEVSADFVEGEPRLFEFAAGVEG